MINNQCPKFTIYFSDKQDYVFLFFTILVKDFSGKEFIEHFKRKASLLHPADGVTAYVHVCFRGNALHSHALRNRPRGRSPSVVLRKCDARSSGLWQRVFRLSNFS